MEISMQIIPIECHRQSAIQLFQNLWGTTNMVVSTGQYDIKDLKGFIAMENDQIIGLLSYELKADYLEIISIDSLRTGIGIGSQLLNMVEELAYEKRLNKLGVITTNDNLNALGFYQKRGFRLTEVIPDAVRLARKIKPEIPLKADNGIPIVDELKLVKQLMD
ncbi:GNAT family N-acetyltransferase [Lactobacillus hilgardii]